MQTLNFQILNSKNVKNTINDGNLILKNKNSLNKADSSSKFNNLLLSKSKNYSDEINSNFTDVSEKNLKTNDSETKIERRNFKNSQKTKKISEKNSNNLEENQKLNQKTENSTENFTLEEQSSLEKNAQAEFVYSDGFSGVQINSLQNQNENENQEILELNAQQLSYLMSKENSSQNDFDALIENASEYFPKNKKEILESVQILSVEEPGKFLKEAESALENSSAQNFFPQILNSLENQGENQEIFFNSQSQNSENQENSLLKNQNFFSVSFNDPSSNQNQIINVKDERSFEEKLKTLEQNLESNSELSKKNSLSFTVNFEQSVQNITSQNAQNAASQGSTFQEMFAQTLNNHVPEFVKAGTLVLKNNNQGEINMNLKPESLGNVKLFLQVSDKVITGQITVHSKEAMEAFKQNLEGIKQAFVANGFEEANINLVMADSSAFSGNFNQQASQNQQQNQQFVGNKVYGDYAYDNSSENASKSKYYEQKDSFKVNVVA